MCVWCECVCWCVISIGTQAIRATGTKYGLEVGFHPEKATANIPASKPYKQNVAFLGKMS